MAKDEPTMSTKSARRSVREASRAAYRDAILEAAIQIFGRTGFRAAKIADIAAEAGVATGTLYNYFSSKEEIFHSILDGGRDLLRAEIEQLVEIEDPIERLHAAVRAMFVFLEEHGALFMIHMQLGGANPNDFKASDAEDEQFRQEMLAYFSGTITAAGDRLRRDIPAETQAWILGGLMHGAITQWIHGGCQPGLRHDADTIMDLFLNGATQR